MKFLKAVLFLIIGIVSYVQYDKATDTDWSSRCEYERYGGDAFTGIQNAAADTANKVRDASRTIRKCFGGIFLLVSLGSFAGFISYGASGVMEYITNKKKDENKK